MEQPARRRTPRTQVSPRRRLLQLNLRDGGAEELAKVITGLLDQSALTIEERVELLGASFVTEALSPFWVHGRSASEAHEMLRGHDPELADAVEAIAPMLLGRAHAKQEGGEAVDAVEAMLQGLR
jgi:hypothetical protein